MYLGNEGTNISCFDRSHDLETYANALSDEFDVIVAVVLIGQEKKMTKETKALKQAIHNTENRCKHLH